MLDAVLGLLSGYLDRLDSPIMRTMDGLMAFPSILLAIAIYRHAADRAIAAKNRQSYRQAAGQQARVKAILEREGRGDEWAALIAALRERHKRLRALQEELENQNLR